MAEPHHHTQEETEEARAQAKAFAAEIDTRGPRQVKRLLKPASSKHNAFRIALAVVFVGLSMWNVIRTNAATGEMFTRTEREIYTYVVFLTAIEEVEAFRDSTGSLPANLDVVDVAEDGLRYSVQGASYTLRASTERENLEYRAGDPVEPFLVALEVLLGTDL